MNEIHLIYCPAHRNIEGNEAADNLAKIGAKKATSIPPNTIVDNQEIRKANKTLTTKKWARRWENTKRHNYKDLVPIITKELLDQKTSHLRYTSRQAACKIQRLKSGHSMLNGHRSKFDKDVMPECTTCNIKETPYHYLIKCAAYNNVRLTMMLSIKNILKENNLNHHNITFDDILGEHQHNKKVSKGIRLALQNYLIDTKKNI